MLTKTEAPLVTPRGIAVYPHLDAPNTKFVPEGVYETQLSLSAADAAPLIAQIEQKVKAAAAEAPRGMRRAQLPFKETETGDVEFKFKMKAGGTNRTTREQWTRTLPIFDANGAVYPTPPRIGGGSVLRVSFRIEPYAVAAIGLGASLRMVAVQVLKLVERTGGGNASAYGFSAEPTAGHGDATACDTDPLTAEF